MTLPTNFIDALPAMAAAAAANGGTDYKALVLVFLNGGNDAHNTVVPVGAQYDQYRTDRTADLSIDSASVLPLSNTPTAGLHPSLTGLQTIYDAGKCAILCNVGPLVDPMTKAEYGQHYSPGSNLRRPYQLMSHSDQQNIWHTERGDSPSEGTGWGGRMAELYGPGFNPSEAFPSTLTVAGRTRFMTGYDVNQFSFSSGNSTGPSFVDTGVYNGDTTVGASSNMQRSITNWQSWGSTNKLEQELVAIMQRAVQFCTAVGTAGGSTTMNVTFPTTSIGNQLRNIARMIRGRATGVHRRQVYFAQMGGYDLHGFNSSTPVMTEHASLLSQLDAAIKAFYDEMVAQGMSNQVTLFTGSDFGRALKPNGTGTDHGWGGHHFIVGGAVQGGRLYNREVKGGPILNTFPTITLGGPLDSGEGRLLPMVAVSEYYATLAKWFGVPDATSNGVNPMNLIFPLLNNFASRDIGFMG